MGVVKNLNLLKLVQENTTKLLDRVEQRTTLPVDICIYIFCISASLDFTFVGLNRWIVATPRLYLFLALYVDEDVGYGGERAARARIRRRRSLPLRTIPRRWLSFFADKF